MVIFEVALGFFLVCVEFQYSGSKIGKSNEQDSSSDKLRQNFVTKWRSGYFFASEKGLLSNCYKQFWKEHYTEELLFFNYTCNSTSIHFFTFCNISTHDAICWNLPLIWRIGFIDALSLFRSPGGVRNLEISHTIPSTCYHLSLKLFESSGRRQCPSLHVDINFYGDHVTVIENSKKELQELSLQDLRVYAQNNRVKVEYVKLVSLRTTYILKNEARLFPYDGGQFATNLISVPKHITPSFHKKFFNQLFSYTMYDYTAKVPQKLNYVSNKVNTKISKFTVYIDRYLPFQKKGLSYKDKKKLIENKPLYTFPIERGIYKNFILSSIQNAPKKVKHPSFEDSKHENLHLKVEHYTDLKNAKGELFRRLLSTEPPTEIQTQQVRLRRSIQGDEQDSGLRLKVQFTFEKTTDESDQFNQHLKKQLAKKMRVPLPSIDGIGILSGTDVSFTLSSFNDGNNIMDDQTVLEAADFLKKEIRERRLRLTDLNGQTLLTGSSASYVSMDGRSVDFSLVILIVLCITLLILVVIIIALVYIARRLSKIPSKSSESRNRFQAYRNDVDFGRDSSQSVGKYSYDSGLWLGPGAEPTFTVPDAPYYRPPTVEQIVSTPRPITSVRTRLKQNWNVDERALSTIPDDLGRPHITKEDDFH